VRKSFGDVVVDTDLGDESVSFTEVVAALEQYTRETGARPLMLGGWEVEHPAMTPPPDLLHQLAECAPHLRHYTYARDVLQARHEAADLLGPSLRFAGTPLTARHVSIQQNSTQALLLALAALKERGAQRVVIAAPAYYAVSVICRTLGLETVIIPAANYLTGALDMERIAQAANCPGSAVLVTNPAYALGVEHSDDGLRALRRMLAYDTWLVLDETRLGLHWRDEAPWRSADYSRRTVVVRSPSKIFFVHGLKISLLLGDPSLLREAEQLGEALIGSLPGNTEPVAIAYLAAWRKWRDEVATDVPGPLRRWRRTVLAALRVNLAAAEQVLTPQGFRFSPVDSGPHVLAAAPREGLANTSLVTVAREQGVLLMTGAHFLHEHPRWQGFRINLGLNSSQQAEAFARLRMVWNAR
jgi:DNA-binding transcriptional MocR family regulator